MDEAYYLKKMLDELREIRLIHEDELSSMRQSLEQIAQALHKGSPDPETRVNLTEVK